MKGRDEEGGGGGSAMKKCGLFRWRRRRLDGAKLCRFAVEVGREPRDLGGGSLRGGGERFGGGGSLGLRRRGQRVLEDAVDVAANLRKVSESTWSVENRVGRWARGFASFELELAVWMTEKEARGRVVLDGRRSGVGQCRCASLGDLGFRQRLRRVGGSTSGGDGERGVGFLRMW